MTTGAVVVAPFCKAQHVADSASFLRHFHSDPAVQHELRDAAYEALEQFEAAVL